MLATTLGEAVGTLLPVAVAVAISPIPIVAVIVMLGTPRARSNGPAFALGWVVGLSSVAAVVLVVTNSAGADQPDSSASTGANAFQIVLGLVLLFLAARKWRGRPKEGEVPEMPKWMDGVDHFGAGRSLGMGLLFSAVNPKNLILTMSAAAAIGQAGLSAGEDVVAIAVFVAIGSVTVVGAVLFYLLGGSRSTAALASMKVFMAAHNDVIMMLLLLVFGVKLLGEGLGSLSA